MSRKLKTPRHSRIATKGQLFVLNRAGRLKLVEDEDLPPIWNSEADAAIKRSMAQAETAGPDGSSEDTPHD